MASQKLKTGLIFLFMMSPPTIVLAAAPAWKILPEKSTLSFIGTQNGSPVKGSFKKFTGQINFSSEQLNESKVKIIVDMSSLATSYSDLTSTLAAPEWFNIKVFPDAIFEAAQFKKIGAHDYQAEGQLTIRDKSLPVTLSFSLNETSRSEATVQGHTSIKRTLFNVGQGEWASTDEVKDDVQINFVVVAKKE